MSTGVGGRRLWGLLIAALLVGSVIGGVGVYAALPTQDGTWTGDWFRELYGWFTELRVTGLTANRVVITNGTSYLKTDADLAFSGDTLTVTKLGATTLAGDISASGNDLTGAGWVNGTSTAFTNAYVTTYYLGTTNINARLGGNWGGLDLTNVDDLNTTDTFIAGDLWIHNGTAYENATDTLNHPESEADYIIWVDGVTYYAKNGHSGQVTTNADASTIINNGISALSSGKIVIKAGVYNLTAPILINKDNISLEGAGGGTAQVAGRIDAGATILQSSLAIDLIQVTGTGFATDMVVGVNIRNMRLRGSNDSNGKSGIWLQYVDLSIIDSVFIDNCDWGIKYQQCWMNEIKGGSIVNCNRGISVYGTSTEINIIGVDISICQTGIYLEGHAMGTIIGCNVVQNDYGIYLLDCAYANRIIGNNIAGGNYGIYLTSSGGGSTYGTIINANAIFDMYMNGITLYKNTVESVITNNNIWDCDRGNTGTYDGIIIGENAACSRNIVSNNQFSDNDRYDVNVVNGTANSVKNNYFGAGHIAALVDAGTNTIINNNQGYITESSGTATILNATTSIAFAHGLSATPIASWFSITFTENPTNPTGNWWLTCNATHAVLNVAADPGASNLDFSWNARKP